MNYFEVFGLDRRLGIDPGALRTAFYELSRRWHPDFQQAAPAGAQAYALEQSALVNAAYRALRDPVARVEYLVRLEEGRSTREGAAAKPAAPPALLAEMFEIQEALADAKAGGLDAEGRARLGEQRDVLAVRYDEETARLTGPLSAQWDAAAPAEVPAALAALKRSLAIRAFLRTVLDDLDAALAGAAGDGESHVAHHRH